MDRIGYKATGFTHVRVRREIHFAPIASACISANGHTDAYSCRAGFPVRPTLKRSTHLHLRKRLPAVHLRAADWPVIILQMLSPAMWDLTRNILTLNGLYDPRSWVVAIVQPYVKATAQHAFQ